MGSENRRELFLESSSTSIKCGVAFPDAFTMNLTTNRRLFRLFLPRPAKQYNPLRRVRELDLLKTTVDAGLLSKLEKNGVDLVTIEKLLPVAEDLGLLSVAANNQQLLLNLVAFFLIEGAPFLLPVVAGALEVGPPAFYLAAAGSLGLDAFLLTNNVEIPFVGLPAGVYLGLLLVPLAVISGGVGVTLAGLKK